MRIVVPVKKQKPTAMIHEGLAQQLEEDGLDLKVMAKSVEFVSFKRVNSDLPELPEYTPRQDPEGASVSLLDPNGNVHAFYVINTDLARVTMDHCFDDEDGEFELTFDTKEAASE